MTDLKQATFDVETPSEEQLEKLASLAYCLGCDSADCASDAQPCT